MKNDDTPSIETVNQVFEEIFCEKPTVKMRRKQARVMRLIETDEKETDHDEK